jgi:hypothetical protein
MPLIFIRRFRFAADMPPALILLPLRHYAVLLPPHYCHAISAFISFLSFSCHFRYC